ncbi:MAG TPA: hypothetical protein VN851_17245 [Thermoanaerobaculia bacterium]|nr:hypothetical protein [Thermoanaerobaculia bacterium]
MNTEDGFLEAVIKGAQIGLAAVPRKVSCRNDQDALLAESGRYAFMLVEKILGRFGEPNLRLRFFGGRLGILQLAGDKMRQLVEVPPVRVVFVELGYRKAHELRGLGLELTVPEADWDQLLEGRVPFGAIQGLGLKDEDVVAMIPLGLRFKETAQFPLAPLGLSITGRHEKQKRSAPANGLQQPFGHALVAREMVIHEDPRLAHAKLATENLAKLVGERRNPALRSPHWGLVVSAGVTDEYIPGLSGHLVLEKLLAKQRILNVPVNRRRTRK